jgi:quercetin dioxygenase-like cupin family protein
MNSLRLPLLLVALALALAGASGLRAADQPTGFSRKVLLEQDLSTAGKHGAIALIEFGPGAVAPKHTHPGEDLLYVIEGRVTIEIDGQAPRELKAGDTMIVPPGVPHLGRNPGTMPAKIVSTYFLEKGQPLASPAK